MTTTYTSFRSAALAFQAKQGCSYDFACGYVRAKMELGQIVIRPYERKIKKSLLPQASTPRVTSFFGF